jgi:hypothetical protein
LRITQHQVADPHRGDDAPEQGRLLGRHVRARNDALDDHRADHQRHHRVRRNAEGEHRDERGLRTGIVGRFRTGNPGDRPVAEFFRMFRNLLLDRVGRKRRKDGAAARQDAEDRADGRAAQDRADHAP